MDTATISKSFARAAKSAGRAVSAIEAMGLAAKRAAHGVGSMAELARTVRVARCAIVQRRRERLRQSKQGRPKWINGRLRKR